MTPKEQQIKSDWRTEARQLLKGYPESLSEFDRLWDSERFQEVYLHMEKFIREAGIMPPPTFAKTDEAFYWLLR